MTASRSTAPCAASARRRTPRWRRLGRPAWLVAPNHYHHLGIDEHARAHAGVAIVATPRAAPRVSAMGKRPIEDEAPLRAALPPHASLLVPPGTRNGEWWLSVASPRGRAWIVGDAFFNLPRTPRSATGLLLKALAISPGLRIGTSFLWLLHDRPAYRAWLLAKLAEERPTVLVPCHGDVVVDDTLPDRLHHLVQRRL